MNAHILRKTASALIVIPTTLLVLIIMLLIPQRLATFIADWATDFFIRHER